MTKIESASQTENNLSLDSQKREIRYGPLISSEKYRSQHFLLPSSEAVFVDDPSSEAEDDEDPFSERTRKVLRLIAKGGTSREIGNELGVQPNSIDYHKGKLFRFFGAKSGLELVIKAEKEGLIIFDDVLDDVSVDPIKPLSELEESILKLIVEHYGNLSNSQVAEEVHVDIRTVERQISQLLYNWNVPNRVVLGLAFFRMKRKEELSDSST
jgi:DNA-binding NarL/FixJ family response regulator